jgi:hypothetical protein
MKERATLTRRGCLVSKLLEEAVAALHAELPRLERGKRTMVQS